MSIKENVEKNEKAVEDIASKAPAAAPENEAPADEEVVDEYYKKPASDSEEDICAPLNCDKEL